MPQAMNMKSGHTGSHTDYEGKRNIEQAQIAITACACLTFHSLCNGSAVEGTEVPSELQFLIDEFKRSGATTLPFITNRLGLGSPNLLCVRTLVCASGGYGLPALKNMLVKECGYTPAEVNEAITAELQRIANLCQF